MDLTSLKKNPKQQAKSGFSKLFIDEETRQRLESRDGPFLLELFREVNPYLFRICAANDILGEHAEDVVSSTWERFFTNLDHFRGDSQIRTFICGILFNQIRQYRRIAGRVSYEEDSEKIMDQAFTSEGWWKVAPHDPQLLCSSKQTGTLIQVCMEGLSSQQKAAFLMKEMEDELSEDICKALGVNGSHLRVLLYRAKDKLRKCLEGKINSVSVS